MPCKSEAAQKVPQEYILKGTPGNMENRDHKGFGNEAIAPMDMELVPVGRYRIFVITSFCACVTPDVDPRVCGLVCCMFLLVLYVQDDPTGQQSAAYL